MGFGDYLSNQVKKTLATNSITPGFDHYSNNPEFNGYFRESYKAGNVNAKLIESIMLKSATATGGMIGINDFGIKGKRQYIADRRYLLDLYVIALNNADIRTAVTHLRNEIFRRGLEYEPSFDYRCDSCQKDYTVNQARQVGGVCPDCKYKKDPEGNLIDDQGIIPLHITPQGIQPERQPQPAMLRKPDQKQTKRIDALMKQANYFGQSLENILRECDDDLNVVDDAFLYCRNQYILTEDEEMKLRRGQQPKVISKLEHLFRLDPVLVEFDLDYKGIPGMRHHLCVFHRDNLLEVEPDQGWELDWKGICPECGIKTKPVYYKYNEQYLQGGYGTAQSKVLYLLEDEVIHWSRYSPTETYGYPPLLSIYEKALTLIGMDRYLYDYFYERKVPQGVVTVVTDNVEGFNATKAEVEARMQQDPHYIPWMAISSKSGQGKMEFVRFAYSLDELNYLPVRDEIRDRISGMYGVSSIWMASMQGTGGLNNETQQLTVMSRVVEGAQRSYHTDVFPKLLTALGVTDWNLIVKTPEETDELAELQIMAQKTTIAQMMATIGFGVRFDSDTETFYYSGEIKSADEQMKEQQKLGLGPVTQPGGGNLPLGNQERAQQGQEEERGQGEPDNSEPPKPPA